MLKKLLLTLLLSLQICAAQTVDLIYFVDSQLNNSQIINNLQGYTATLNYILSKNTSKQFRNAGVFVKNSPNFWSGSANNLPTSGYQIWVDLDYTDYPFTHNGYLSFDQSGAAVLADIRVPKIYDPFNPSDLRDYWQQITTILHEYAHVFGAGIGEYYNLINIQDRTGIHPIHNLSIFSPFDSFWQRKPDFIYDPLTWNIYNREILGRPNSLYTLLTTTRYSFLTANLINFNYRYPFYNPATANKVVINLSRPSNIKIWSADNYSNNLLINTNASGSFVYPWNPGIFGTDNLRLIKISNDLSTNSLWLSVFDLQIEALHGRVELTVEF